jgi:hypothetical protein
VGGGTGKSLPSSVAPSCFDFTPLLRRRTGTGDLHTAQQHTSSKELEEKLLSGSEWGGGLELAVWANFFGINMCVWQVHKDNMPLVAKLIKIDQQRFDYAGCLHLIFTTLLLRAEGMRLLE